MINVGTKELLILSYQMWGYFCIDREIDNKCVLVLKSAVFIGIF